MEAMFRIADMSAHGILYLMGVVSILSISIMIERYFSLRKVSAKSKELAKDFRSVLANQDLNQIEALSKKSDSL
jgi:hypothetical protein